MTSPGQSTRRTSGVQYKVWKCFVYREIGCVINHNWLEIYLSGSLGRSNLPNTKKSVQKRWLPDIWLSFDFLDSEKWTSRFLHTYQTNREVFRFLVLFLGAVRSLIGVSVIRWFTSFWSRYSGAPDYSSKFRSACLQNTFPVDITFDRRDPAFKPVRVVLHFLWRFQQLRMDLFDSLHEFCSEMFWDVGVVLLLSLMIGALFFLNIRFNVNHACIWISFVDISRPSLDTSCSWDINFGQNKDYFAIGQISSKRWRIMKNWASRIQ